MSGALYRAGASPVHRLAPEVKIVAALLLTVAIVSTPREAFPAFAGYLLLVSVVAGVARVSPWWLATRATIELPFVVLAVVLPFIGNGREIEVVGVTMVVDGLYAGWNILAKGTLGVLVSLLLAATTTQRDLIVGLDRLRCPQPLVQIATFMLRYLQVLIEEAGRMRVARLSRAHDPRFLWHVRALAHGVGALFLRAYERGERVYLAMLSRGYSGRLPAPPGVPAATVSQWTVALTVPGAALMIVIAAR